MSESERGWSWLWPRALFIGFPLFGLFAPVIAIALVVILAPASCSTESKRQIHGLGGLDFEISATDCDGFGGSYALSVLVAKAGAGDKTLLFKYSPDYRVPLPEIAVDRQNATIRISVPEIESIYSRSDRWRDMEIKYDIGAIHYIGLQERDFCKAHPELKCDPKLIQ